MWFIGCAEEGEYTEKLPVVGACVLQAVVDMEALITFLIQAGIQPDIIRQEITLPDQLGFAGIAVPEKFVFMNGLQIKHAKINTTEKQIYAKRHSGLDLDAFFA